MLCFVCAAGARAAQTSAELIAVNARLASIATAADPHAAPRFAPVTRVQAVIQPPLARSATPHAAALPHLPPAIARLARIEHLLDYHTAALDANMWGMLDGGRGCSVKLALRF